MFKEIKLPEIGKDYVDLAAITPDTKGVIIGFKDNKAVCYIYASDNGWGAYNGIHIGDLLGNEEDTLPELINRLLNEAIINSLKLIELQ